MTATILTLPVVPEPADPMERFSTEEARQAYFAGYADALTDRACPDGRFVFITDAEIRDEMVRRGLHLTAVAS